MQLNEFDVLRLEKNDKSLFKFGDAKFSLQVSTIEVLSMRVSCSGVDAWMSVNDGRRVAVIQIAQLFAMGFGNARLSEKLCSLYQHWYITPKAEAATF